MEPHSLAKTLTMASELLQKRKLDQFELYAEKRTATRVEVKDQKVDSLSRMEDVGLSVRVLKDHRMGFSYTTSLEPKNLERAIESACAVLYQMPADEYHHLPNLSQYVYPEVHQQDFAGPKTPIEKKINLVMELEAQCKKADARITAVRSASFSESLIEVWLKDSSGEELYHPSTLYTLSLMCKAEQAQDAQMGYDFGFANEFSELKTQAIAREAARNATELLGAKPISTRSCPALLKNSVVSELIDFLSSSFSAEEIDKGRSLLQGRFGERLFSPEITLIDDGLYPNGFATQPFDGEGVPCSRKVLVDGGFIKTALYDTYYAHKNQKHPTGSASRSIKSPPTIGCTNVYIKPGQKSLETLITEMSQGILITDLMGIHTANPVTGDFSLGASGILIEKGKLGQPVRGFAVAGNVLELFKRMTDIGSDLRFFGSVGAPSVRVSEISIGGE